jgi:hypothetical protein
MGFINQKNKEFPEKGDEFDHMTPAVEAEVPLELIIVDRAWPSRWDRVKQALGGMLDRVQYIPSKPSKLLDMGYRAVNVMRNSGAIVSSGDLLAFVDDFCWLDPKSIEASWREFSKFKRILCPVFSESIEPSKQGLMRFSGHNPGIYMCGRNNFKMISGFDENFDGAYGEADTEWQNRLDKYLYLNNLGLRHRKNGVIFRRTYHHNGIFPEKLNPPWFISKESTILRCNIAYYHCICQKRLDSNIFNGSVSITNDELKRLETYNCSERLTKDERKNFGECEICNRDDRKQQIQSYKEFPADICVVKKMKRFEESNIDKIGCYNPWS